jgi:hypothetical protein
MRLGNTESCKTSNKQHKHQEHRKIAFLPNQKESKSLVRPTGLGPPKSKLYTKKERRMKERKHRHTVA